MKKQDKHTTQNQVFANLEKYHSIDLEGDWNIVRDRINFQKSRQITPIWRAAAVAIVLLGIGFLAKHYVFDSTANVTTMAGEMQKEVLLPDGSKVHLNKYAELVYPEKFRSKVRELKLTGEGFFEVSRDPARPFIVSVADRASVEVLGTSFNISSSQGGESVSVQVIEGRVAFYTQEDPYTREILGKDDQATLNDGVLSKSIQKDLNFLSWKTGIILFNQDHISSVIQVLGNHYNREFILDNSVDISLTFTSTIDNQDLESVLEELNLVLGISSEMDEKGNVKLFMAD